MDYIIYNLPYDADIRHWQITRDAIMAGFLQPGMHYDPVIYHPQEDLAALPIIKTEGVYYQDAALPSVDFSIFFTAQELAGATNELLADWFDNIDDYETTTV